MKNHSHTFNFNPIATLPAPCEMDAYVSAFPGWDNAALVNGLRFAAGIARNEIGLVPACAVREYFMMVAPSQKAIPCENEVRTMMDMASLLLTEDGEGVILRSGDYFKASDQFWFDWHIWPKLDHSEHDEWLRSRDVAAIFAGLDEEM